MIHYRYPSAIKTQRKARDASIKGHFVQNYIKGGIGYLKLCELTSTIYCALINKEDPEFQTSERKEDRIFVPNVLKKNLKLSKVSYGIIIME